MNPTAVRAVIVKALTPYRIAALLLLAMSIGHTAGEMLGTISYGAPADAVFALMKSVHFDFHGSSRSYYDLWLSLGLVTSLFLLLSAIVAWHLAGVRGYEWRVVAPIAWALAVAHFGNALLSCAYSHKGAAVITSAIALLLGIGAHHGRKRSAL
jgi:hypothetical protein